MTVTGPKGSLTHTFPAMLAITQDGDTLTVSRPDDSKQNKSLHGLSRSLLNNMVHGRESGFTKTLEFRGWAIASRRSARTWSSGGLLASGAGEPA